MRTYDAGVRLTVTLTYYVTVEAEADGPEEAEDKIRYQALGLTRQELDRMCDGHGSNQYEGAETTVLEVGDVGPPGWAPEDGPYDPRHEGHDDADYGPPHPDDSGPALDSPTAER